MTSSTRGWLSPPPADVPLPSPLPGPSLAVAQQRPEPTVEVSHSPTVRLREGVWKEYLLEVPYHSRSGDSHRRVPDHRKKAIKVPDETHPQNATHGESRGPDRGP